MVALSDIQALANRLAGACDAHRIVLFGSHAAGSPRHDADVDLLVVAPLTDRPSRMALKMLNEARPSFPVDLLVRDPNDAQGRYDMGDPLIREAFDRGQVLHERSP